MVELARAAGLGRLGHVAIDSTRVAANASPNRVETKERLRAERARIRRRIRRWQQACNADDPNEASGLELKKEEMTRLQERLAEIPSRLEQGEENGRSQHSPDWSSSVYKFMGKAHSNAFRQVRRFFPGKLVPRLKVICGRDRAGLKAAAQQFELIDQEEPNAMELKFLLPIK